MHLFALQENLWRKQTSLSFMLNFTNFVITFLMFEGCKLENMHAMYILNITPYCLSRKEKLL